MDTKPIITTTESIQVFDEQKQLNRYWINETVSEKDSWTQESINEEKRARPYRDQSNLMNKNEVTNPKNNVSL